jgi:sugar phosphate isomerase/epimerase
MRIGLFTPVFQNKSLDELLTELKHYPAIETLELGTGGWPGGHHLDLDRMLASEDVMRDYHSKIMDAGLQISALSCHGNPLHPLSEIADRDDALFRKTVRLAEKLGVTVVVTFSGCPGGSPRDQTPNWIVTGWPPENADALAWQWDQRLVPYWRDAAAFAANCNVKVAIEAHPGFSVYNTDSLLRLRKEAGAALGINLDPSHLWWQGIDIPTAIHALGDAIFHVHAKDVA